jgi:hypothetical protein
MFRYAKMDRDPKPDEQAAVVTLWRALGIRLQTS